MNEINLNEKLAKATAFQETYTGWTFVYLPEDDTYLGIKPVIIKIIKYLEKSGAPVIHPKTKEKLYGFEGTPIVRIFSKEEYGSMMRLVDRMGMK